MQPASPAVHRALVEASPLPQTHLKPGLKRDWRNNKEGFAGLLSRGTVQHTGHRARICTTFCAPKVAEK